MQDPRSDAELLSALRDGDRQAYAALWNRHVGAAYKHARRLYPSRADDLVSESFLAIYQQVTTTSKGPTFAFRSYLKAVMRNTAVQWRAEAGRVVDSDDVDRVDPRDALSLIEREADAADLLGAFEELPERWQQVLWLSEVAAVGRPEIARQMGLAPNAVSALQRRARGGLKLQWLSRQVPVALRDDQAHVARLLPRYLAGPADAALGAEVDAHVARCATCADVLAGMRIAGVRLQNTTLAAVGFGALGITIPGMPPLAVGTAAAAVGSGIALTTGLVAGGLGALLVGGLIITGALTGIIPPPAPAPTENVAAPATPAPDATPAASALLPSPAPSPTPEATAPAPAPVEPPRTGRHNDDPTIDSVDLVDDPDTLPTWPERPGAAGPGVPGPGTSPGTDPGDPASAPAPSPGVSTPAASTGYLAPVIGGVASTGSSVAVEVDGTRYTPAVAGDGAWSFDPRGLEPAAGTHTYSVWAYDAETSSPVVTGEFTVLPIEVTGFEGLAGFEDMQVEEAQTTGLVIALTGPANGTIWVQSMTGHSAMIALDDTGHAVKRLRMNSRGWYHLTFRALDADGFWGPPVERSVDVYDPDIIFDPWGPSPEDMTFDFVEP
ncbi:sigma-70 family RNA polymerase sigma factor [Microbacterium bovistercoris]|nr:sigma-70 family RNA polymerase sigma factor [Microbacterium bovistercoris]